MISALILTTALTSGCYTPRVVVQQAPVVVQPQVLYLVGADLRIAAAIQQQLQADPQYQQFLQWKSSQVGTAAGGSPPQVPISAPTVRAVCGRCHSGPEPKDGLTIDGSPMAADLITQSIRSIVAGRMPKQSQLSPEMKSTLYTELLSLEKEISNAQEPTPGDSVLPVPDNPGVQPSGHGPS